MSNQQSINQQLKAGVEAARAGRNQEAQSLLQHVLRADPENISATFWLAFVLPDPQDSIRLLERVLSLDPGNQRAKAGIQWAQKRRQAQTPPPNPPSPAIPSAAPPIIAPSPSPSPASETEMDLSTMDATELREKLLSKESTKAAKKGPLAHRARRTFDMTILFLAVGAFALLALTFGTFVMGPTDTLAAWLPKEAESLAVANNNPKNIEFVPVAEVEAKPLPSLEIDNSKRSLTSETDTILMKLPELMGVEAVAAQPVALEPVELVIEPSITTVDPASLIGPEVEPAVPAENLLLAHQPASPGEKWIEVNVSTQQITAWEGATPLMTFTGSTGLPNTPTVIGEFNIYWKLESTLMAGADYYLPEVPYTMYFYQGYALHGAYWHNNFGQPMSHGCVNLALGDAKTLFEWADPIIPVGQTQVVATLDNPGTLVVVHQ